MIIASINEFQVYRSSKLDDQSMSADQRIQAAAEVLIAAYFYNLEQCSNLGLSVNTDVKVNPPSKKDIDIQLCENAIQINIEVKTPAQDFSEQDKFQRGLPHRYPGLERAEENPDLKEISSLMYSHSGIETQIQKTNDNKIKDYINGANSKFGERDSNRVNVLTIVGTTEQMGKILLYLMNPHSGLITQKTYDESVDLSKIDYIVLSNAVEGIVNSADYVFGIGDLSNYITLIFSPHKDLSADNDAIKLLFSVMPNENNKFCAFEKEYAGELRKQDIPDEMHYLFTWSGYLAKKRPEFAFNRTPAVLE